MRTRSWRSLVLGPILGLFLASPAQAHWISRYDSGVNNNAMAHAHNDCGRAWDWACYDGSYAQEFPHWVHWSQVGKHTWVVQVRYTELDLVPIISVADVYRGCITTMKYVHTTRTSSKKKCDAHFN